VCLPPYTLPRLGSFIPFTGPRAHTTACEQLDAIAGTSRGALLSAGMRELYLRLPLASLPSLQLRAHAADAVQSSPEQPAGCGVTLTHFTCSPVIAPSAQAAVSAPLCVTVTWAPGRGARPGDWLGLCRVGLPSEFVRTCAVDVDAAAESAGISESALHGTLTALEFHWPLDCLPSDSGATALLTPGVSCLMCDQSSPLPSHGCDRGFPCAGLYELRYYSGMGFGALRAVSQPITVYDLPIGTASVASRVLSATSSPTSSTGAASSGSPSPTLAKALLASYTDRAGVQSGIATTAVSPREFAAAAECGAVPLLGDVAAGIDASGAIVFETRHCTIEPCSAVTSIDFTGSDLSRFVVAKSLATSTTASPHGGSSRRQTSWTDPDPPAPAFIEVRLTTLTAPVNSMVPTSACL
jgi:hypothetical protein